jgi:site-specific DNA-methyltransferase (adenine-specific)
VNYSLLHGDCLEVMPTLPAGSVHCVVTSPPYWNLRDYGADGQLGLEETPEAYVATMVEAFRQVWRVLRDDGTVFLNLGDSMLPNKSEAMIPHRVAMALMEDGWICRSTIIWHKPNPMPESVTDRPTKAHEYIFLLTKAARYFYDAEAVREKSAGQTGSAANFKRDTKEDLVPGQAHVQHRLNRKPTLDNGVRNRRSVWTVATQPLALAHFATFPPKLIEPCILAGTSQKGCCPTCGAPWERVVEVVGKLPKQKWGKIKTETGDAYSVGPMDRGGHGQYQTGGIVTGEYLDKRTTGWQRTCTCNAIAPVPCTVLDPFSGAGTTGVVAGTHGRNYIGIELNLDYLAMSDARIGEVYRVGNREWAAVTDTATHNDLPLFAEVGA